MMLYELTKFRFQIKHQTPIPKQLKVLIVDNVDLNRMVLTALLEELGIVQITSCSDGLEAIEAVQNDQNFDIILMNICIPSMTEIEASQ